MRRICQGSLGSELVKLQILAGYLISLKTFDLFSNWFWKGLS